MRVFSLRATIFLIAALFSLWLLSLILACLYGAYPIQVGQCFELVCQLLEGASADGCDPLLRQILIDLRLPRTLLALLCGGGLALSGLCLQGVLNTPLADPFTLGISQGAACGVSVVLVGAQPIFVATLGLGQIHLLAAAAFVGASIATAGTLWLGAGRGRFEASSVLLAGIAMATFLGALVALVKALNEDSVASIVFWILGSFQGRSWETVPLVVGTVLPGIIVIICRWRALDVFFVGDEQALHMGLAVARYRVLFLLTASFMTAGCVAAAGVIGFVGLVVPHILRLLFGCSHAPLLLGAFFGGGILLVWADVLARIVLPDGQELPVGVITALIGGPFFALLLKRRERSSQNVRN